MLSMHRAATCCRDRLPEVSPFPARLVLCHASSSSRQNAVSLPGIGDRPAVKLASDLAIVFRDIHHETMTDTTSFIRRHYEAADLLGRIMRAVVEAGHDVAHPTVEMFHLVDQLHGGGINSTKAQAEMACVMHHMRALDAGCGVGGSSRYLAKTFACRVEAIDITPEYVAAAARLNELCGLGDMVRVCVADVANLPYGDQRFDLVWCQNVAMNVADKRQMFSEAFRVLAPRGRYAFSHAAQGPAGEPYYPLPWAREPSYSFLGTPDEILKCVRQVGFVNIRSRARSGGPGGATELSASEIGQSTIMGADMPARQANAARSMKEGRLVSMLVVAEHPSG
jgi:SAM-dependent methyltransferase